MSGKFFKNGAIVIAVYPDGSGETKATFQYKNDADSFCQMPRDKGGPMLISLCLYEASFRAFPAEPETTSS